MRIGDPIAIIHYRREGVAQQLVADARFGRSITHRIALKSVSQMSRTVGAVTARVSSSATGGRAGGSERVEADCG
jgi:hypothetical protein